MNKKRVPNKIRLPNWEKPTWMCSKSSDLLSGRLFFNNIAYTLFAYTYVISTSDATSAYPIHLLSTISTYMRGIIVQFQRPDKRKTLINVSRGMEN